MKYYSAVEEFTLDLQSYTQKKSSLRQDTTEYLIVYCTVIATFSI